MFGRIRRRGRVANPVYDGIRTGDWAKVKDGMRHLDPRDMDMIDDFSREVQRYWGLQSTPWDTILAETLTRVGLGGAGAPGMPPIDDEAGVVSWFLDHDQQLGDLRANFPQLRDSVMSEVLGDLSDHTDAESLKAHVSVITEFHGETLLPQAAMRLEEGKAGTRLTDDDVSILAMEALAAAKMRILGYFLLKRYGIDPRATLTG